MLTSTKILAPLAHVPSWNSFEHRTRSSLGPIGSVVNICVARAMYGEVVMTTCMSLSASSSTLNWKKAAIYPARLRAWQIWKWLWKLLFQVGQESKEILYLQSRVTKRNHKAFFVAECMIRAYGVWHFPDKLPNVVWHMATTNNLGEWHDSLKNASLC